MVEKNLTGRVAIVTGGGGGMGRAIALALIERGACVTVFDVRKESVDETVKEAAAIGGSESALAVTRDVTKSDDCESAVRETIDAFNSADILVNAAGIEIEETIAGHWVARVGGTPRLRHFQNQSESRYRCPVVVPARL